MRRLIGFVRARFLRAAALRRGAVRAAALACSLAVGALALGGCGAGPRLFGGPGGGGMRVVAFFAPVSPGGTLNSSGRRLLTQHRALVSAFTPLWYHVQNDGTVKSGMVKSLAALIHREGIALIPLVNNAAGATQFLVHAGARRAAVDNLVKIVQANNYQGIHIDFELLKPEDRQGLDLFMKQLYGALHPKGKRVSIDVIPEARVNQHGQAYDYRTLARYADSVVLMSYDEHDDGSQPGPVASLPWVKQRLDVALKAGIPANKLDLGIADYGYDWPVSANGKWIPGTKVPTLGVNQIEAKGVTPRRDASGDPHYSYTKTGRQHDVWYEDQTSVVGKLQLAKQRGLHGVALWQVGYENAAFWNALQKALRG